jgi:hypothetical protein
MGLIFSLFIHRVGALSDNQAERRIDAGHEPVWVSTNPLTSST